MVRKIGVLISVLVMMLILAFPAYAAEETEIVKELDATTVSSTEFTAGDEGVIQISIQNNNTVDKVYNSSLQSGLSSYFGAAVSLSAVLDPVDAPITLKNDKALLGNLPAGNATPAVPFGITVKDDAAPADYTLKLTLSYRVLKSTSTESNNVETVWEDRTEVKDIKITIKAKKVAADQSLDFKISRLDANKFAPGDTSSIQICLQNNQAVKKIDGSAIQVNVSQNYGAASSLVAHVDKGNAPITIKTDDLLLGTLPAGQATSPIPVTLEVDENAVSGTYQAKVTVTYKTLKSTTIEDGDTQFEWSEGSVSQNINIEIKEKLIKFAVANVEANLTQGANQEIKITFKNIGTEKAESATAKVSALSPLSLTDNSAYLGDLEPGQSATGTFGLKVAGDAIAKEYTLDSLVQYTDSKGNSQVSDTVKAPVTVIQAASLVSLAREQWVSAAAGAGILGIIWIAFGVVKSSKRKKS